MKASKRVNNDSTNRGSALFILGVLMLVTLAGGLVLTLLNPATFSMDGHGDPRSGEWTASYQDQYEEYLPLRHRAGGLWGLLRYRLFREGGDGVLVGDGNWLFTSEEFAWHEDSEEQIAGNLAFIRSVRDRLRDLGVELLVAPIPAKARVYPQKLGRYQLPEYAGRRYPLLLAALKEFQIPAADLADALIHASDTAREPNDHAFLRSDTHWSPEGAHRAARAIAEQARSILEQRAVPAVRYVLHRGEEIEYMGDLVPFLGLGPFVERCGPSPERLTRYEAEQTDAPTIGLFDEVPIPVILIGTSYSAGRDWSFEQFLKFELRADVLNLAEEGRGPFSPMRDFLAGETIHQVRPQLVIWEIPERYLPVRYDLDASLP